MDLINPESEPSEMLVAATHIVTQLTHNTTLTTALNPHFTTLVALALIDLKTYPTTKDEAESSLTALLDNRIAASAWDMAIRDLIVKTPSLGSVGGAAQTAATQHAITASQGLQHLADLATATTAGSTEKGEIGSSGEREIETTGNNNVKPFMGLKDAIRGGYVNILGGDAGR